ncbi:hypothetical protein MHBO_003474 [Bonamia ostreae]|uniref:Dynein heavy chain tail domain-containing protein n=1 Tax=Bonamia ostreae TaxID=126728 RepID=A0ABV2AQJ5_9EUKA
MIANAKRAASLILIKIEEEFSMICQILEEQKTVFRGVQSKDFEGKETFEMVKEIVLDNDLVISWEPPSLDKFNSARMCTLNDKLYAFKSNHQIMSELQGEAENEPELYFKNVSPANLKEIIEATANLSNFVIVSAHALNDCEIKNTAQYEIICLDYETIFNSIKESLENIIEAMKTPKKCLEKKFEDDFDKTREFCDKIMENFDMYFEAVKKFLGTRKKWSIIKQDVSFEQYRLLWGLNAYFYALKKVMRNVIVLQQIAVFLVQNQQHMLWRDN